MRITDNDWAAQRSEAAAEHLARLEARQEREHRQAQTLLLRFISAASAAELPPVALRVQGYVPGRSARTEIMGWYLRGDQRAAVDTDGNFYVLTAPLTLLQTFRRFNPSPSRPPLVLGQGGRDGDSIELSLALDRLLPGWDSDF